MAEFASRGIANAGLTTGIIGTSLGALNSGILGNIFGGGCNCNGDNAPVNRYEMQMQQKIGSLESAIALRDANIYNDSKALEIFRYFDGKIEGINAKLCEQAVFNATQTAAMNCMGSQIAQLYSLTKLVIPNSSICTSTTNTTA